MTDSKIFLVETNPDTSTQYRHLSIVLIQDGKTYIIDGLRSQVNGVGAGVVPVATPHNEEYGNVIINYQEIPNDITEGQIIPSNWMDITSIVGDADDAIDGILAEMSSVGPRLEAEDSLGNYRSYYDYDVGYIYEAINSNSVANTLLSAVGIDMQEIIANLGSGDVDHYVGQDVLLDSPDDDSYTVKAGENIVFVDNGGDDNITVQEGGRVTVTNDNDPNSSDTIYGANGADYIDGGADAFMQIALIAGKTGLTDEMALEASGVLVTA